MWNPPSHLQIEKVCDLDLGYLKFLLTYRPSAIGPQTNGLNKTAHMEDSRIVNE